jgi:hypothetical protein
MLNETPFKTLFQSFGRMPIAHAESVNREAAEKLTEALSVPFEASGHCILLRAPRAGHGKTHLLSVLQHRLGASHEFIPLQAISGNRIDETTILQNVLQKLTRPFAASAGLSPLDLYARRLFALALEPLVTSGEVPCEDRDGALASLKLRAVEIFDFQHPSAVTAHWVEEHFKVLAPRFTSELSNGGELRQRDVMFWLDRLFQFATTPTGQPGRNRDLFEPVFADTSDTTLINERLVAFLGLLSALTRVVLVADELEGFSADVTAALRLATVIVSLRQSVERVEIIVSVNQDVWENAFLPRLSGGLEDRLSEVLIELHPLRESEMIDLLNARTPSGEWIFRQMGTHETHARGLIRHAGVAWQSQMTIPEQERTFSESTDYSGFAPPPLDFIPAAPDQPYFIPEEPMPGESDISEPEMELSEAADVEFDNQTDFAAAANPENLASFSTVFEPVDQFESDDETDRWEDAESLEEPESVEEATPVEEPVPIFLPVDEPKAVFEPVAGESEISAPIFLEVPEDSTGKKPFWPAPTFDPQAPFIPVHDTPPSREEEDRVVDLLKQFRERYGAQSL